MTRPPLLVPLEPRPVELDDGSPGFALSDPYGVLEDVAVVSQLAYWILAHFDGSRGPAEVVAALEREGLRGIRASDVERIAEQALEAGLVYGPPYHARRHEALQAFRKGPRKAACAGSSYPADPDELRELLGSFYDHPEGPGHRDPLSRSGEDVRLLVAPHIDFERGGPVYAQAYRAAENCAADLYVVFGTAHASPSNLFTLTRQDYETPIGTVTTDRAVVDALAAELGESELFGDELVHVREHSCEFQMVWLRWLLGDRPFRAVPVLCSSIAHLQDPSRATSRFLDALGRATSGRRVCFVASADLAHVGPQYGDRAPPSREELSWFEEQDLLALSSLAEADSAGFHRRAVLERHRRRLCGVAPIFAAMRASGRGARLLRYHQWTNGVDMVSFAAAAG